MTASNRTTVGDRRPTAWLGTLAVAALVFVTAWAFDAHACKCVDAFRDLEIRIESVEVDGVQISDLGLYDWDHVTLQRYGEDQVFLVASSDDTTDHFEAEYERE